MENVEELKALKQENSKLKLEARLRKSLASELERQKTLVQEAKVEACLLYTSPSPRDLSTSRMPSSA